MIMSMRCHRRLAGGQEDRCRASAGTFPTNGPLFVGLLVGVILIVGGLTFFPALALGPIVEHFAMMAGTLLLESRTSSTDMAPDRSPHVGLAPHRS